MTDATPARAVFYHRVGRHREDTDEECRRQARRLADWAESNPIRPALLDGDRRKQDVPRPGGRRQMIKFAFYGRANAENLGMTRLWQYGTAAALIRDAGGEVVAEYMDTGVSRNMPWQERPRAKALLEAFEKPGCTLALAVADICCVLGPGPLRPVLGLLARHGVPLWAPEFSGLADPASRAHQLIIAALDGSHLPGSRRLARTQRPTAAGGPGQVAVTPVPPAARGARGARGACTALAAGEGR
jgi:hypothetical protein